jgi:NAD(P)-dependent dehydrogenase (short-subunit alcohol dehydrogenase family)
MSYSFAGKVAVVTGGGSGIGRSTALALARRGVTVHVADLDLASAERVRDEAGGGFAHQVDVTDAAAVEQLAETVYAESGRVDILMNNAGIGHAGTVEHTPLEDWQAVISVNLMGVIHGVHAFIPRMLEQGGGGHVVNTASMLGLVGGARMAPYTTSKFGVVGLSEALDAELRGRGIRFTALCPGIINTNIVVKATARGDVIPTVERAKEFYAKRGASPDVVAAAALRAIERRRPIAVVPRSHVVPLWGLKRVAPPVARFLSRHMERLMGAK